MKYNFVAPLGKQESVLQLLYISENVKAGRFSSRDKFLYGKHYLG